MMVRQSEHADVMYLFLQHKQIALSGRGFPLDTVVTPWNLFPFMPWLVCDALKRWKSKHSKSS